MKEIPRRKRVPFIEQMQQTECGLCCMAMMVGYYKSHVSLYELRERIGNGRDGTSLLHLKKLAEKLHFEAKSYRASATQLKELVLPAILFWENNHFVVLEKVERDSFTIVDPGSGRRRLKLEEFSAQYTGYVLILYPGADFVYKKRSNVWLSFSYLITDRPGKFIRILLLTMLLQLFTVGMPVIIQYAIDTIIVPMNKGLLNLFLSGVIGLILFHSLFTYIRGRVLITLHNEVDYVLQSSFFKHLLQLPYKFFLLRSFGDLLFRASSLKVIRDQLTYQVVRGFLDSAILLIILLYMFVQSSLMGLIVVAITGANVILIAVSQRALAENNQLEIKEHSEVQGIQTEMLYGIFGIKTSGVEERLYTRWVMRFKNLLQAYRRKETVLNYINTASSSLQLLAPLIILWIGAHQIIAGSITLGVLVAFHAISGQFFALSGNSVQMVNSFILTTSYLKRIEDVLEAPQEENEGKMTRQLDGNIELRSVSFSYTKYSEQVIRNVSLDIKKGQKVALIGQSGSGKTTLANIMIGVFTPTSGDVLYDGISYTELNLQHVRQQIGTVPQDVTLFNRSIYENITLHKPDASPEEVVEVAKIAQIHDEIMRMPMQYHTMISEMGMNVSGGQRQRIALAKALLGKPSLLLLDEATSSLDHINETKIDEYLSAIQCTRIVIAHRLTTVMNCDLIAVMENGQIIDCGTHRELLESSSFYSRFYKEMIS